MGNILQYLRLKASNLPLTPGVYIMKDKNDEIIYIGKAKALKNRVSTYFSSQDKHLPKVRKMVSRVCDFDYILTDTEFEALVLECSLIKQHSPKYNILLKDDKGYNYIKVTNEKYKRILACKQKENDGAEYIGPYTSTWSLNKNIEELRKIFKLPNCNIKLGNKRHVRPCLEHYISLCTAPCCGKISCEEYNDTVDRAVNYLKSGSLQSKKELQIQMKKAAENLEFEKAAKLRDNLNAIDKVNQKQKIIISQNIDQDVFALVTFQEKICMAILRFKNGKLVGKEEFFEDIFGEIKELRSEFIKRYYSLHEDIPKFLLIDGDVDDFQTIEQWLGQKSNRKVQIIIPKKGERKKLVEMCKKNAYESIAQKEGKYAGKDIQALEELQKVLGLNKLPNYIESYDISNIGSAARVAAMVVFENGKARKNNYRKFKIKDVRGQDDYSCMKEVLTRRFSEYEKRKDKSFSRLPDLILLDGGTAHVTTCAPIIEKYNIPLFGMVKDSKHRSRAIAKNNGEISLTKSSLAMKLITNIQDEVHRVAISYHRKLRDKNNLYLTIQEIPGVGEKRAKTLIKHFKSIDNIKEASLEELNKIKCIDKSTAQKIFEFYHK